MGARRFAIRRADFLADEPAIRKVRFAVFVEEQGVPPDLEMDERDVHCHHLLAVADDAPIGTGRIDVAAGGKIGRVAVLAAWRGTGVGTALMAQLHDVAREYGLPAVWCHAQTAATSFYERLGYHVVGEQFLEAGIAHVRMERSL